jgi:hypothetical protein
MHPFSLQKNGKIGIKCPKVFFPNIAFPVFLPKREKKKEEKKKSFANGKGFSRSQQIGRAKVSQAQRLFCGS